MKSTWLGKWLVVNRGKDTIIQDKMMLFHNEKDKQGAEKNEVTVMRKHSIVTPQ